MSKKPTVRDSILTVVDTVILHTTGYNNADALQQAADQLASYCESQKDPEFSLLVQRFMDLVPFRFTRTTDNILDHLRKEYENNG